ncbi:Pycsar system effector family protein [Streptomyces sp. BpilaLS-43]|uniref:Pycsar system effector family protein n=1 Tax=Streptomyces sp. BpilaLS-43 TaxID=1839778 RepID=UPI00114CE5A8|nr:Pycsar system effector family protein [Streptomyces sp. BpilaLS-43]
MMPQHDPSADREGGEGIPSENNLQPKHAWKALNLVNDWVKHAETKSVATLAAAGVAGGVAYNLLKGRSNPGVVLDVVAVVGCLMIFIAGLFAMAALAPQLKPPLPGELRAKVRAMWAGRSDPDDEGESAPAQADAERSPTNLLFYGDVKRQYEHDAPTYAQVLSALTGNAEEITNHIALQVHANSLVANRKYVWANRAIRALRVGLICLALIALIVSRH